MVCSHPSEGTPSTLEREWGWWRGVNSKGESGHGILAKIAPMII